MSREQKNEVKEGVFQNACNIFILIYSTSMNGKQVIKKLQEEGWKILRINGSHYRLVKKERHTVVPVHGNKDIPKGLVGAIGRQTGVKLK